MKAKEKKKKVQKHVTEKHDFHIFINNYSAIDIYTSTFQFLS